MRRLGLVQNVLHATINLGTQVETRSNSTEPAKTSSYWRKIWNERDVQVLVLTSLALQLFLLFAGNVRRRYRVGWLRFLVWIAYLAASVVAVSAIGLFSQYEDKYKLRSLESFEHLHTQTMPFLWAPFLLLHLGGPDTITAFSVEDNNLWSRQLLSLVTQLSLALYVFWKSFDLLDSQLLAVAVPLFVAGVIKYGERIWALRKGSRDELDFRSQKESVDMDAHGQGTMGAQDQEDPFSMESTALGSALSSRGLLVGRTLLKLGVPVRSTVLKAFAGVRDLEFVLMELSMIYDMLYTKTMVLQSRTGSLFRFIALAAMMVAFVLFWVDQQHLHAYRTTNAAITYTLFVAAIFMEVYSFLMVIASPWTRARFKVLRCLSGKLAWCFPSQGLPSPSMGQFNLVDYSLSTKSRPKFITHISQAIGLEKHWRNFWYVKHVEDKEIVGLLFNTDPREGFARLSQDLDLGLDLKYLLNLPFKHALFRLHIATEMYLCPLDGGGSGDDSEMKQLAAQCRKLSNYLMYLMAVYPSMLPVNSVTDKALDTEDLMLVFAEWVTKNHDNKEKAEILHKYAEKLNNETQFKHFKPLLELPAPSESLKQVKDVWVRLLMYAAGKCRMELHARQLNDGVELLTLAGSLMRHNGIGDVGFMELNLSELTAMKEKVVSLDGSNFTLRNNFTVLPPRQGPLYAFQFTEDQSRQKETSRQLKLSTATISFMGSTMEDDEGDNGESGGGATSRASVKLIHQVISGFDGEKRRIAAQTGLKGMLNFPDLGKLNNKLSFWLMSHVDAKERAIVIDEERKFSIDATDVNKVFDITCEGTSVMDRNLDRSEATINIIRARLGMDAKDGRSLKAAQAVLERVYVYPMSDSEEAAFKTAFVVFVMGRLLAPRAKNDYSSIDFWPALIDPSSLAKFNWAEHVVEEIFEAATKLKADIRRKKSAPNITGCPLFLQVRYLDSLDLGILTMPQDIIPRIGAFSQEILKAMIFADSVKTRGNVSFGAAKLRDADQCIYSKASPLHVANPTNDDAAVEKFLSEHGDKILLEMKSVLSAEGMRTSAQVVSNMNTHSGRKGLLQIVSQITMAPESHVQKNSRLPMDLNMTASGEQGASQNVCTGSIEMDIFRIYKKSRINAQVLVSSGNDTASRSNLCGQSLQLGQPMHDDGVSESSSGVRSFNGKGNQPVDDRWTDGPSFDLGLDDLTDLPSSPKDQMCTPQKQVSDDLTDLPSSSKDQMCTPQKQVFRFVPPNWYVGPNTLNASPSTRNKILQESYMFERDTRFTDKINLNAMTLDFDESYSPVVKRKARITARGDVATTGIVPLKYCDDICLDFYKWVASLDTREATESIWIMHHVPRYIELSGAEIIRQLCRDQDMEHDIFNVLTRRLHQAEDENQVGIRNKHYMESDFVTCILAGSKPSTYISIRNQLIGSHITYDVPSCKLIFFTGLIEFAWVSYVADLIEHKMVIYDPTMVGDPDNKTVELHLKICSQLKAGISECANELFDGWDYNWENLAPVFHINDTKLQFRHHTGLYTINFCKYFDGETVRKDEHNSAEEKLARYYLYDLMHLKGNTGFIPRQFVQTVDA